MTGSGYINASQDKMKSRFDSVAEQTGLYAGSGGFDVTVGSHTQLDGAVIASTASADKNSLDNRFGGFDVIAPDGRGARFDPQGNFCGFLEP
jgi:filamentous hemagglutinin